MKRFFALLFLLFFCSSAFCLQPATIAKDQKCPTCGMRVAGFKNWHTQMVYADGSHDGFCAVKCLMAFYFEPARFSARRSSDIEKTLYAKDYYTQTWHNMRQMFFVLGSNVMSPMGRDLVPFSDKASAQTFLDDHNGEKILQFRDITPELIQKMRHKKGKGL